MRSRTLSGCSNTYWQGKIVEAGMLNTGDIGVRKVPTEQDLPFAVSLERSAVSNLVNTWGRARKDIRALPGLQSV